MVQVANVNNEWKNPSTNIRAIGNGIVFGVAISLGIAMIYIIIEVITKIIIGLIA